LQGQTQLGPYKVYHCCSLLVKEIIPLFKTL